MDEYKKKRFRYRARSLGAEKSEKSIEEKRREAEREEYSGEKKR